MIPAAVLQIAIQATGVMQAQSQIRGLHGDLGKADKQAGKTRSTFSKIAGGAAAIGGIAALTGGVNRAIDEFEEARKVAAQTRAVIKSTGGSARVTAKDVESLAGAISKKAGIDDEAIQTGANLLLTFKNIRNEAGKGRDIFNQATAAAVDLSAAGFGSLESTSKQLGKALNDPIKGMTALSRSGVTFSEDQKKAIEALMATGRAGDRVKAQQLILKEVMSQVGGSAAAQATTLDRLKVMAGNLAESAGGLLIPALEKAGRVLLDLGAAVQSVIGFFREHQTLTTTLVAVFGPLTAAVIAYGVAQKVAAAATGIAAAATAAWNAVLAANPIVLVIAAIAALVAAFVIAYKKSETFRNIVNGAWNAIKTVASAVFGWLKGAVVNIVDFIKARWENLKTIIQTYWSLYRTLIINPIRSAFEWLREAVGNVAGFLKDRWENIKSGVSTAWNAYKGLIIDPIGKAFSFVREGVNKVASVFEGAFDRIKNAIRPAVELVKSLVGWVDKIKPPDITPWKGLIPGNGGKGNGTTVGPGAGLFNSIQSIADYSLGWGLSGGRGPGQAFRPGDDGYHGQNRARDLSGPMANMLAYARMLVSTVGPRLLELIFTPLGFGIKNGQKVPLSFWGPAINADHIDHIHTAMANGGYVRQGGWAVVGEKGPELARLPSGSSVYSNADSRAMLAGETHNHFHFESLVPPSPQQAYELGRQAARGFSFQGGSSSRTRLSVSGRPR